MSYFFSLVKITNKNVEDSMVVHFCVELAPLQGRASNNVSVEQGSHLSK